jgi:hypothetical protein
MKLRKQRSPETIVPGSAVKARLRNFGNGALEFDGSTIKFYVAKGLFKKRKEIAREILIADIESIERVENELSITWKEVTDRFVIEKAEFIGTLYEKITEALETQRKKLEEEEALKQKQNELPQILGIAIKIIDSLFDILRSLQGRINWNHMESYFKSTKENFRNFADQKGTVNLDFTKLSVAIKEHLPDEISKETHSILKSLYEYFSGLTSQNEPLEQSHPNPHDAKTTILAYYTLNDIILGTIVGDEEIGKERNELAMMIDDLSKGTNLKINFDAIKDVINKLGMEKEKENIIEESRAVFMQQLNELIKFSM